MAISKPLYGTLLAFVVTGVVLLLFRGVKKLGEKGETDPPRPIVERIGFGIGLFGVALLVVTGITGAASLSLAAAAGYVTAYATVPILGAFLLAPVLKIDPVFLVWILRGVLLLFAVALLGMRRIGLFKVGFPRVIATVLGVFFALVVIAPEVVQLLLLLAFLAVDPVLKWVIAGGITLLGAGIFFLGRSFVRKGLYRAIAWWFGAAMGGAFAVLATLAARMPTGRAAPFRLRDEVVRFSALGTGVIFLLFVLAALLPIILDRLEQRGFTPFVGARHVRATKSGFLTVISVLSMAGVAVSSCALCSVTSIMGGFGADLKRKILGNNAHIVVDVTRPGGFGDWETKVDGVRLALAPQGGAATPVVAGDAMASSASNTAGALVRGIDLNTIAQVIDLKNNLEVGRFDYLEHPERLIELPPDEKIGIGPGGEPYYKGPDFKWSPDADPAVRDYLKQQVKIYPSVIIGRELAKSLHVLVGDEITLLSPIGELGPTGVMPRTRRFRVAGIFYSGMYEYDATHAYVKLEVAQSFFSLEDRITNIDIRVPDPERVMDVRPAVDAAVAGMDADAPVKGAELRVRDWMEMNRNLFSALKLEKIATFIILSIAIAVASFCIICTLLLMVTEKGKEIAILKALGASDRAVMHIFMIEGVIIGGIGTVFGVGTAFALCTGLSWFGVRLDPDVYYIDRLPVNVNSSDYAMVAVAAFIICTIATIYPAHAASKLTPVDGLRYE
ncbi:MAG TPA: FtsX-like permease family protein [Polyangiaceae bacterium]|nr:FtsX-like permease family protein [Polyangiaceae bacterium]